MSNFARVRGLIGQSDLKSRREFLAHAAGLASLPWLAQRADGRVVSRLAFVVESGQPGAQLA
jgi:hypothetical protein